MNWVNIPVNLLVFLIPTDSGERLSYAITVLLAITVFLSSVSEDLPNTSNPMSILSYYLLSNIAISVLICFLSILIVHLNSTKNDSTPIPHWVCKLLTFSFAKHVAHDNESTVCDGDGTVDTTVTNGHQSGGKTILTWTKVTFMLNIISGIFCVVCQLAATSVFFATVIYGGNKNTL
jgi:hypothetical protein